MICKFSVLNPAHFAHQSDAQFLNITPLSQSSTPTHLPTSAITPQWQSIIELLQLIPLQLDVQN